LIGCLKSMLKKVLNKDDQTERISRLLQQLLLGLALTLALVMFVIRGVAWGDVWTGLEQADLAWCGVALSTVLLTTVAKVYRWQQLFPERPPSFPHLASALLVGQVTNAILPIRLGELARSYLVNDGLRRATALGTIAAEKTFDVLFLLLCVGVTVALAPLPRWVTASLTGVAIAGGLILFIALILPQQKFLTWLRLLPGFVGKRLCELFKAFFDGLMALRRPHIVFAACAWSIVIWTLAAATNYVLFRAFRLPLSIGSAFLLLILLHVGVAPPSLPTQMGIFHGLTVLGLEAFDVERSLGLAYATLLHAIVYLPQIVLGGGSLMLHAWRIEKRERVA
jgi:hypothetical protein